MSTSLEQSVYHKCLRVAAVVMICVLVFQSGVYSSTTTHLSSITGRYLTAAVGISVGVPENELNVLTKRIAELETQVGYKDAQLRERELALGLNGGSENSVTTTLILAGIQLVLLVLIVFNYVLDYVRGRRRYLPA